MATKCLCHLDRDQNDKHLQGELLRQLTKFDPGKQYSANVIFIDYDNTCG